MCFSLKRNTSVFFLKKATKEPSSRTGKADWLWQMCIRDRYTANAKSQANEQCREAVRFILRKNILCGDALTMLQADGSPIVFAEWSLSLIHILSHYIGEFYHQLLLRNCPNIPGYCKVKATNQWEYHFLLHFWCAHPTLMLHRKKKWHWHL